MFVNPSTWENLRGESEANHGLDFSARGLFQIVALKKIPTQLSIF
jgi:hypothetical protein